MLDHVYPFQDLIKKNPLLDLRLASHLPGLVLFTGGVGSGKHEAACAALEFCNKLGKKCKSMEDSRSGILSTREDVGVLYFGDIEFPGKARQMFHFFNSGYIVVGCMHAIHDEGITALVGEVGMPQITAIDRVKQILQSDDCFKSMGIDEGVEEINKWIDFLLTANSFLEVKMESSSSICNQVDSLTALSH